MGLFTFSISSYFSFAHLRISRDLSITSMSSGLLMYNLSQYSLIIVLFFGVDCDLSSLICDFIYLFLFSFLVDKAGQGLIHFLNYFEESALSFIIPFYCFVVSVLGISALIFIFSLLLQALGFVCFSFSSLFRCRVRLCIGDILFLEVGLYCYILPSQDCLCYILEVWRNMFSFSFILNFLFNFLVTPFILQQDIHNLHVFLVCANFFLLLTLHFIASWSENVHGVISTFLYLLYLLRADLWPMI